MLLSSASCSYASECNADLIARVSANSRSDARRLMITRCKLFMFMMNWFVNKSEDHRVLLSFSTLA